MRALAGALGVALIYAAPAAAQVPSGGTCRDPWVTRAVTEVLGRPPEGTRDEGECNYRLYGGGRWTTYDDLLSKVRAAYEAPAAQTESGGQATQTTADVTPPAPPQDRRLVAGNYPASACAQPVDPAQAALDSELVAKATTGGLPLAVAKQCAGFSVIAQAGVGQKTIADYIEGAEIAYRRLSADAGGVLTRRAAILLFSNQQGRQRGEELLRGARSNSNASRLAPAYASSGDIWVNAAPNGPVTGPRFFATNSDNYLTATHELVHVFADAAAAGRDVPKWFEEGLAEHYASQLGAPLDPAGTEWLHGERRALVLEALKGNAPQPLLGLSEIDTHAEWDTNYPTWKGNAQYDVSYMTMLPIIGRSGLSAVWTALRDLGADGPDFETVFGRHFGVPLNGVEALVREGWRAETAVAPKPYTFSVTVAPGGDRTPSLFISTAYGGRIRGLQSIDSAAGTFTFEIDQAGNVRQTGGPSLGRVFVEDGNTAAQRGESSLTVSFRNPSYRGAGGASGARDSTAELVQYNLHYGQWSAGQPARKYSNNDTKVNEVLPGTMSAAFPDGNSVSKPQ
jgi:hypothetical protein